jgi:hypothetical protein
VRLASKKEEKPPMSAKTLTKTAYALTTAVVLAASPALAMDDSALSAFAKPSHVTGSHVTGTQAYASAHRNGVVRSQPRNVRPFTQTERKWFLTAQGYEDRF